MNQERIHGASEENHLLSKIWARNGCFFLFFFLFIFSFSAMVMSLIVYFRPFELYIRDSLATCAERKKNIFNFYLFSSSLSMEFEHTVNVSNTKTNFDSVLLPIHPSNHHLSSNSRRPTSALLLLQWVTASYYLFFLSCSSFTLLSFVVCFFKNNKGQ